MVAFVRMDIVIITTYAIVKGVTISFITLALTNSFVDSLVIALVSGVLGIIGAAVGAYMGNTFAHRNVRPYLDDIKRATGADRRAGDHIAEADARGE